MIDMTITLLKPYLPLIVFTLLISAGMRGVRFWESKDREKVAAQCEFLRDGNHWLIRFPDGTRIGGFDSIGHAKYYLQDWVALRV